MGSIKLRLQLMMFLQYFVWGAWFVTLGVFLGAHGEGSVEVLFSDGFIGAAYGTAAIGAMVSPFFIGMIADRFFSSEKVLAALHFAGACILLYLSTITDQSTFWWILVIYFLCYMPTLSLTNSLSMHHLKDPSREFPGVRVLGTIGWIAAGLFIGYLSIGTTTWPMVVAATAQFVLAGYCLVLPHTPPNSKGESASIAKVLGLDALKLLEERSFAIFVIGSFLIAIPLQFYYNYTPPFLAGRSEVVGEAASFMSMGQMSEIFFMLLMPFFFIRLGVKKMLLIGILAWAIRYALFGFSVDLSNNYYMLLIGILLHGVCYDFFFVTGQLYVDKKADPKIRGAAQGFIAFVTLGVGAFIGAMFSAYVEIESKTGFLNMVEGEIAWRNFWLVPALGAFLVLILFALTFKEDGGKEEMGSSGEEPAKEGAT
ncbi:MAG: nucleoside permease [Pirellulaceae bacterium]|nr:nucleoside permease [Pirellulaceae bacterium]